MNTRTRLSVDVITVIKVSTTTLCILSFTALIVARLLMVWLTGFGFASTIRGGAVSRCSVRDGNKSTSFSAN